MNFHVQECCRSTHPTPHRLRKALINCSATQGMVPRRVITDRFRSYGAARGQIMSAVEHRSHKGMNNRAENSHLPLQTELVRPIDDTICDARRPRCLVI